MKKYTLSTAFRDIRNYLAGKAIGITRDRALLHEVVKCLFCNINQLVKIEPIPSAEKVAQSYNKAFTKIKNRVPELFRNCEEINLDQESIFYIHTIFSKVDMEDPHSDPLSELYQAFVGADIRGNEGQFFTPTEAVRWLVEAIAPKKREKIVDPACGAGSFLSFSARYLRAKGVGIREINSSIFGIEKDEYLSQLAKTHIALTTLSSSNIVCADSIERKTKKNGPIPFELDGQFDIVLANPPFGSRIKVGTEETREKFDLAFR
ncbi:MAG: N-6 DNA methylase, partial [Candidatus Poribacteria bacterium]|nr:N-6 DNA methylase [Candidatus Poribacteria bacterium]